MSSPIQFIYLNRTWVGRWVVNENDTRYLPKVTPAESGPPWPRREEYRGAVAKFRSLAFQELL